MASLKTLLSFFSLSFEKEREKKESNKEKREKENFISLKSIFKHYTFIFLY